MLPVSCTSNRTAAAACSRTTSSSGGKCYDDGWGSPAFVPPKRDDDLVKNAAFVQAELSRLRTSTAAALQQAWDEEQKSADKDERIRSLERELETSRESERRWRVKYEELKQSVMTESLQRSSSSLYSVTTTSENTDEERPRSERRPSMLLRSLGQRFSNNFEEGESDDDDEEQHASAPVAATSTKDSPRRRTSWLRGPPRRGSLGYYGGNDDDDDDAIVPAAREDSLTSILTWGSGGNTASSARSSSSSTRKKSLQQRKEEDETEEETHDSSSAAHLAERRRLRAELSARDAALAALHDSAELQSAELDEVRSELALVTADAEARRGIEAAEFRTKLETRTKMIVRQRKKERECGEYIQELATELERCYRETAARVNE